MHASPATRRVVEVRPVSGGIRRLPPAPGPGEHSAFDLLHRSCSPSPVRCIVFLLRCGAGVMPAQLLSGTATVKGRLLLALIALPFAGIGLWMAWSLAAMLSDAGAMREWRPVPAEVESGGYSTHSGEDSDTYRAYGRYRYVYGDRSYTGERVQLSGGADNIGDYQQTLGRRLARAAAAGTPITVYVDPADPGRSVVERDLRWSLVGFKSLFVLTFGGVGTGMLVFALRTPRARDPGRPEYQASPWLVNPAWQSPAIRSNSKATMWGAWLFATFWNLVSAPLPFVLYEEVAEEQNYLALVGLVFPLVGLGLLAWAVRRSLEWRRFGPTPLTLDPFPGSIGGHVGGTIDTRLPLDHAQHFRIRLAGLESYVSGSGKNRRRSERVLWEDERLAHASSGPGGTRLSFRFDLPDGLNESDAQPSGDSHYLWRLSVDARLPGADLDRDFEIPVYRTARRSQGLTERTAGAPADVQATHYEQAVRKRVRVDYQGSGKALVYPMAQHAFANLVGFLTGVLFAAVGAYLAAREGEPLFGAVIGITGALVTVAALYLFGRSLHVTVEGDRISSVRRWFGLPLRRRTLKRGNFLSFEKTSNLQTRSAGGTTRYFRIRGIDRDGGKILLGENFAGEGQARAAMRLLERELGLRPRDADPARRLNPAYFDRDLTRETY